MADTWFLKEYNNWIEKGCPVRKRVKHLQLEGAGIDELSINIDRLQNLTGINVSRNHLRELPPTLWKLHKLEHLNVSHNNITEISPEINGLTNLVVFEAAGNLLTTIPNMKSLMKLEEVEIWNNHLTEFPFECLDMQNLRRINIKHNDITDLPKELFDSFHRHSLDSREHVTVGPVSRTSRMLCIDDSLTSIGPLKEAFSKSEWLQPPIYSGNTRMAVVGYVLVMSHRNREVAVTKSS